MLIEVVLLVLLGAAVAAFGTIVGAGGGFVLVPILLILYPDRDPATLAAMSLIVVLTTGLSGTAAYARQRRIDYVSAAIFGAATIPGAISGALLVQFVPRDLFAAGFAILLIGITIYLLLRSDAIAIREPLRGRGVLTRMVRDGQGTTFFYSYRIWQGAAMSTTVSFIGTLAGIGGGVMQVPLMVSTLRFPVHIAVATSPVILVLTAVQGVSVHFATGHIGFDASLGQALLIGIGAVPGAQLGAWLSRRLGSTIILRVLSVVLILVAARLLWSAFGD